MKYLTIIDGTEYDGYSSFDEKNLKMVVHKGQFSKEMNFKPVQMPMLIFPDGSSAYLNHGYIRALIDYESKQQLAHISDQLSGSETLCGK